MKFPTLYKKTSTGAIQEWTIFLRGHVDLAPSVAIYTRFGQVDGEIQETFDLIKKGKNIGKKNETTPEQQAISEAKSKWEKQKKKGYVESIESAEAEEIDILIEGGISPMLAHSYKKHNDKIKYPAFVQPKLDGIRCIAILKDGKCTLWSRTRKAITSMPHIVAEIEALSIPEDVILDGELYNEKFKNNFEHIVHLVRQEEPDLHCTDGESHIYDLAVHNLDFEHRMRWINTNLGHKKHTDTPHIVLVSTKMVANENEVTDAFLEFCSLGYEGAMLRNSAGKYVNKRSYDLLKIKEMLDSEFEIVGIEEGRGKLSGHVGAFICKTLDGLEFKAKMSGDTENLKKYFDNHSLWENKHLTVQYQG